MGLRNVVFFIAFMTSLLAVGGALAHAFEMPRKMALSREAYFTVQTIYAGWDKLAFVLIAQLVSLIALAWLMRNQPAAFWPVLIAILALLAAQAVFWTWTFPANKATDNWTVIPEAWQTLRRNWEYSHFAGALLQLACATSLIIAALSAKPAQA